MSLSQELFVWKFRNKPQSFQRQETLRYLFCSYSFVIVSSRFRMALATVVQAASSLASHFEL